MRPSGSLGSSRTCSPTPGSSAGPTARRERVTLAENFERFVPRLAERAADAGMELVGSETDGLAALVRADGSLEQVLFNLVDNACKYAVREADRRIHLDVRRAGARLEIAVRDHGPGIADDARCGSSRRSPSPPSTPPTARREWAWASP